jgi:hypothetical protein
VGGAEAKRDTQKVNRHISARRVGTVQRTLHVQTQLLIALCRKWTKNEKESANTDDFVDLVARRACEDGEVPVK